MPRALAILTDYGPASEHVGALHAVLAREAPGADRIDLAHDIPPGGIRWASLVLGRLARLLPADAVVVAVVDPTVGTQRRGLALRTSGGVDLVGPDNGLLLPAAEGLGGIAQAAVVEPPPDAPRTFHGRDLFAPVAARLAQGAAPADVGEPIEPDALVAADLPEASVGKGRVDTEIAGWDRFGNVATLAPGDTLDRAGFARGDHVIVHAGAARHGALLTHAFADVPRGDLMVHVDSHGWVAIAVNGGSAASVLSAEEGARLAVVRTTANPPS
jgi:S-adenosylmethionine hydrolase